MPAAGPLLSVSSFTDFLASLHPQVEQALDRVLPSESERPVTLSRAMRYSVFAGGKRVRPALVVLGAQAIGPAQDLLEAAAAVELVHTFSLIHDDLPALDNDTLRRGQPTAHVAFDEATALLAGDALLNLGLGVLTEHPKGASAEARLRAIHLLADAVGPRGMIGGQIDDLACENQSPADAAEMLVSIHRRKTGALLVAALRIGGCYAGASAEQDAQLARLGDRLGLLFQIGDDMLDIEGDTELLGKTAGKDEASGKLTFPRVYGLEESRRMLEKVAAEASDLAASLPRDGALVTSLIDYLTTRKQ